MKKKIQWKYCWAGRDTHKNCIHYLCFNIIWRVRGRGRERKKNFKKKTLCKHKNVLFSYFCLAWIVLWRKWENHHDWYILVVIMGFTWVLLPLKWAFRINGGQERQKKSLVFVLYFRKKKINFDDFTKSKSFLCVVN